jgi:hypothetical protein
MPVLCGLVQETATKDASALERHLQSLEDQLKAVKPGKQQNPKKVKGDGRKKNPQGILKNKGTPAATKKSAPSISPDNQGTNNSTTVCAKGKKKTKGCKVSFNGKKAAKPTKLHK